jgi:hypothetical protein
MAEFLVAVVVEGCCRGGAVVAEGRRRKGDETIRNESSLVAGR